MSFKFCNMLMLYFKRYLASNRFNLAQGYLRQLLQKCSEPFDSHDLILHFLHVYEVSLFFELHPEQVFFFLVNAKHNAQFIPQGAIELGVVIIISFIYE